MQIRLLKTDVDPDTGSKRIIFALDDSSVVESAIAYHKNEVHLCVSTQVGCPIGCKHCATTYSSIPFARSLSSEELNTIIGISLDIADKSRGQIVLSYGGHGEPLLNWNAVGDSHREFASKVGKIYLTTVGINGTLPILLSCSFIEVLFVSLHGSSNAERRCLIPPHPSVMDCDDTVIFMREYAYTGRVLVANYAANHANTSKESVRRLAKIFRDLPNVALRVFAINPVRGKNTPSFPPIDIEYFINEIRLRLPTINIRHSKPVGQETNMACGQMRADKLTSGT